MRKPKVREHNEWFRQLSKRSCPCGNRKITTYSWGEYVSGKWRTVEHFCQMCFRSRVVPRLKAHAGDCGCSFNLVFKGGKKPSWLRMEVPRCKHGISEDSLGCTWCACDHGVLWDEGDCELCAEVDRREAEIEKMMDAIEVEQEKLRADGAFDVDFNDEEVA